MTVQTTSVSTVSSISSLLALVQQIVSDVKSGKPAATVLGDASADFISCLEQLPSLPADASNKQALVNSVAVGVAGIVNVFVS